MMDSDYNSSGGEEEEQLPEYNKHANRIKEMSFNERIERIGGDRAKFSRRLAIDDSTEETYFADVISKWRDQDYGVHFRDFMEELRIREVQTYAQILLHKKRIFECLLKHMAIEGSKSLPAFCEILEALAKDLKEEFHDFIWPAFDVLVNVLDLGERDADSVEAAFFALTLLVKITWRKLLKDNKKSFTRFIPLFSSSRSYVRRFASEAFAFLMRKAADLNAITLFVVDQALKVKHDYLTSGIATLFFNVFKGIGGNFHSNANQYMRIILCALVNESKDGEEKAAEFRMEIARATWKMTVEYVKKGKKIESKEYEDVFLKLLDETCDKVASNRLLSLLPLCFPGRSKAKTNFECKELLYDVLMNKLKRDELEISKDSLDVYVATILIVFTDNSWNLKIRDLCTLIVKHVGDNYELNLSLFSSLVSSPCFDLYLMPAFGLCSQRIFDGIRRADDDAIVLATWKLYATLCSQRRPIVERIQSARSPFFEVSPHLSARADLLSRLSLLSSLPTDLAASLLAAWPCLFNTNEKVKGCDKVMNYLKSLLDKKSCEQTSICRSQLILLAASGLFQCDKQRLNELDEQTVLQFIRDENCSESAILFYGIYIKVKGLGSDDKTVDRTAQNPVKMPKRKRRSEN